MGILQGSDIVSVRELRERELVRVGRGLGTVNRVSSQTNVVL